MKIRTSPLVQLVDQARRPSRWWSAWLVTMIIIIAVPAPGIALGNAILGAPSATSLRYPYVGVFPALITALAVAVWVKFKEGRPLVSVGLVVHRGWWWRLLAGFGLGAAMISAWVGIGVVLGVYRDGQSTPTVAGVHGVLALFPLVLLFAVQNISLAALTPGYLVQTTARQLPGGVAIVGTSALVAVLHTLNPIATLNLFLFAMLTALVALHQGSLWVGAGIQTGWSCLQTGVFGLPVAGITGSSALLTLGPTPDASPIINGGHFGIITGLIGTVILLPACAVAYVILRRTASSGTVALDLSPTSATSTTAPPTTKGPSHVANRHPRQVPQPAGPDQADHRRSTPGLDDGGEAAGRPGPRRP